MQPPPGHPLGISGGESLAHESGHPDSVHGTFSPSFTGLGCDQEPASVPADSLLRRDGRPSTDVQDRALEGRRTGVQLLGALCGSRRVDDVLSGISTTHLSNLLSSTSMMYHTHMRKIQSRGPNGTASFSSGSDSDISFSEFPRQVFHHLETFTMGCSSQA